VSAKENGSSATSEIPVAKTPLPLHDLVYIFKVSRRANPVEFKNLWQLVVKTPSDPNPIELVDADSLSTVIAKIGLVFEEDGL